MTTLCFDGWDIADRVHQVVVIEPVDPFEKRELNRSNGSPGPAPMDRLGVVRPVNGMMTELVG
jgi:hypothetical protein